MIANRSRFYYIVPSCEANYKEEEDRTSVEVIN